MADIDLVVTNARIYTGEPSEPIAEALACAQGRIRAIGTRKEIDALSTGDALGLDAEGRRVLPGFIDPHVHLIFGYQLGDWVDLTDRPSFSEVGRRLREYLRTHPKETAIVGHGFDYAALRPGGLPNRYDLDAIVEDVPAILTAWDGHTGWANSRFVERAQAHFATIGREVGEPERDPHSGELTGVFRRSFDLEIPELQARRSLDGLRRTLAAAARLGITTAFDVQVPLEDLGVYGELRQREELPIRVRAAIYHPRGTDPRRYGEFRAAAERWADDWFRVAAVKLYIDGVQETHTAAVLEPYADRPDSRGETVYTDAEFRELVRTLDKADFQILTHSCGDRGVRIALDAYEAAAAEAGGPSGRRHRIEHCETVAAEDRPRFGRLDVVPCMMPRHSAPELTRRWREVMGDARWWDSFPWRELLDSGARLAFSSDWPVADLNPLVNVRSAVARAGPDGRPSPHRLSVAEALDAYTRGAAYASHCEADRGTLAVGKYADFVVLDGDPLETPVDRLGEIRVATTVVGGRIVHSEGAAPAVRTEPIRSTAESS
jgi:predicted amidohydrolase YtcJ